MSNTPHFVYTRGTKGPCPEIWHNGLDYGMNNWRQPYVIVSRAITAEEAQSGVDALVEKYPLGAA
jgi:hypothetical protein